MKKRARTFALCSILIVLGCALVFPQVGADKRPTSPPKTSPPKTPPKRTTTRTTTRTASPAPRSKPRQTAPQIEMVLIPAGTFMMGSPNGVGDNSEHPQHQVSVQSFYIGKYEVTQAQYRAVMGANPSKFKGDDLPAENVSWNDAKEFCQRLSQMTGKEYRLPTEAEWEYACRAGTTTEFAFGNSLSPSQANFKIIPSFDGSVRAFSRGKTTPVGNFEPNRWGLYDMHGNVSEWVEDLFHDNYDGAPTDDSPWLSRTASDFRILRGGDWDDSAEYLRSAARRIDRQDSRYDFVGFRVVASARS